MATEAQIAANRLNSQKSTGPRTDAGKAIVSRNAEKHTKLSRTLLVSSQSNQESSSEFKTLCDEYYESLDPVGPIEEMLVDRIVSAVWRMRRAHHVESGEIAMNLQISDRYNPLPILLQAADENNREDILPALDKTVRGCEFILERLNDVRAAVQRDGRLTSLTYNNFNRAFRNHAKSLTDPLSKKVFPLEINLAKIDPDILQEHQKGLLDLLDQQIQYFEEIMANRRSDPDPGTRARQDAAMLPGGHTLERILRYETVLERQIFNSMAQLEKLQSRRLSKCG